MSKVTYDTKNMIAALAEAYRSYRPMSVRTWERVLEMYPLLQLVGGIQSFGTENGAHWIEYVVLKDLDRAIAGTKIPEPGDLDPAPVG